MPAQLLQNPREVALDVAPGSPFDSTVRVEFMWWGVRVGAAELSWSQWRTLVELAGRAHLEVLGEEVIAAPPAAAALDRIESPAVPLAVPFPFRPGSGLPVAQRPLAWPTVPTRPPVARRIT